MRFPHFTAEKARLPWQPALGEQTSRFECGSARFTGLCYLTGQLLALWTSASTSIQWDWEHLVLYSQKGHQTAWCSTAKFIRTYVAVSQKAKSKWILKGFKIWSRVICGRPFKVALTKMGRSLWHNSVGSVGTAGHGAWSKSWQVSCCLASKPFARCLR